MPASHFLYPNTTMNYEETIDYLYRCVPMFQNVGAGAYKEGLYNTICLDNHFGNPHKHFMTIHVAGTNGKGSCSHSLAAILQKQGYKTGLYTSPHLVDFRERIRVNGECVSKQWVVDFVEREKSFFEPLRPSFFELTTAMAFKYFAEQKVDIAVIEVGLGGRLDCTNIISPVLSVITNISLDHTQFLGNTLAQIAGEKAGIIKPATPVVIGSYNDETRPVFEKVAAANKSPRIFAQDNMEVISSDPIDTGGRKYVTKNFGEFVGELGGDCQVQNTNTILNAVKVLLERDIIKDKALVTPALKDLCETTGLMGRWQQVGNNPRIICDTGHNPDAWNYISRQLATIKCKKMRIVFGMVDDKDFHTVMQMLPKDAVYYFTKADSHRAVDENVIAATGSEMGLKGSCYPTVREAAEAAVKDSSADDFVYVGGSSYVVADYLAYLNKI